MAEKPTAAFILSLIGAVLIIINAMIIAVFTTVAGAILSIVGRTLGAFLGRLGGFIFLMGIVGVVIGIIILVGAFMINSEDKTRITTGSIIVIVFSVISFLIGGGFIMGSILCIVGGILGLTWSPKTPSPPPPP